MDFTTDSGRKELGTRIQAAIMEAGFASLPEFARQMGWSRALIYQYVSGKVLVQLDRLQQIAERTGKSLQWLLDAQPPADAEAIAGLQTALAEAQAQLEATQAELSGERAARLCEGERQRQSELALLGDYCRALRRAGDAAGLVEAASRWLESALRAGDQRAQLQARLQMGHGWFLQGQLVRAGEVLSEAVAGAMAQGQGAIVHSARQELVRVLLQAGRTNEARHEAAALAGADLWWPRWAGTLMLAAIAAQQADLGECAEQLQAAEEIIESGEETPARRAVARTYLLSNRVTAAIAAGDYLRAAEMNEALRSLAAQASAADQSREAELNRAIIALRRGHVATARESLRLLGDWAQLAQDARLSTLTRIFQSELARRLGSCAEARDHARAALEQATTAGQPHLVLEAHLALAYVEHADARHDDAAYHLAQARRRALEHDQRRLELEALLLLRQLEEGEKTSAPAGESELVAALGESGIGDLHAEGLLLQARWLAPDARLAVLEQAATTALGIGYFWGAERALRELAAAYFEAGDVSAARQTVTRADELLGEAMGDVSCCPAIKAGWRKLRDHLGMSSYKGGASR